MAYIEHCEGRQKPDETFLVSNWDGNAALYIFTGVCKAQYCKAPFYAYCYYDWDGNLHKRTPSDLFVATGRLKVEFENLIASGVAAKIDKFDPNERKECRRGVPAGVGEWTLKARTANGMDYVLKLLRAKAKG